jgi:hypothetical protein
MRCVILQPSYIPWRGYFDLIRRADVFVFYDDVQYDTRGWRNRNRVKTPLGTRWMTIPVRARGAQTESRPINSIETAGNSWAGEHWSLLERMYGSAPHFNEYRPWLERTYSSPSMLLADFTIATTIELARRLGIASTRFLRSSELGGEGRKTDRLLSILEQVGATRYLSGPSARNYIQPEAFDSAGIQLEWARYDYPEYPQLYPPFDPAVSILDLMFMTGPQAPSFIWGSLSKESQAVEDVAKR